ncbi:MAG: hypothetical protein JW883_16195 [Deltaproteobacteria bacterium]|nr:hypothetical protein [Deltaproteobacteria bacterium]
MPTITAEIWISMAYLAHRSGDLKYTVRNRDLVEQVYQLFNDNRPGVAIHVSQHVVAQAALNTGYNKCYLSESGRGVRRLFVPGDKIHQSRSRNPQGYPRPDEVPVEYQYLLTWYLDNIRSIQSSSSQSQKPKRTYSRGSEGDSRNTLSYFIANFDRAYQNFYQSDASYRYFTGGPCIYFHRKTIDIWIENIAQGNSSYDSLLVGDEFPEAIYATLTAWGMNRLGGGAKLKDYDEFKKNVLSVASYLEEVRDLDIMTLVSKKDVINRMYSRLDPSENVMNLVAKSKTMHHLNPEAFPPIDKRYTLKILRGLHGVDPVPTLNGIDFDNYWNILSCFRTIIDRVGEATVRSCIGRRIMDTSITKIVDNAIVGFSNLDF